MIKITYKTGSGNDIVWRLTNFVKFEVGYINFTDIYLVDYILHISVIVSVQPYKIA